jgi:hypothetical protein
MNARILQPKGRPTMKKTPLATIAALCVLICAPRPAPADQFLDRTTYAVTTNAASAAVLVTNWPGPGAGQEWYPAAVHLHNRGGTGEVLRVELIQTACTNLMVTDTNGALVGFALTNVLVSLQADAAGYTNWIPAERWYVVPPSMRLRLVTVSTNGELIVEREINR